MSRKAYSMGGATDQVGQMIEEEIEKVIKKCSLKTGGKEIIFGTYINYYRNGFDFLPSHSHKGMVQMVISLGATRKLTVGKKVYNIKNGDVIVFGSSSHGIPIEPEVTEGRISIATFMKP